MFKRIGKNSFEENLVFPLLFCLFVWFIPCFFFLNVLYTEFCGLLDNHVVVIICRPKFPYFKSALSAAVVSVISTLISMLTFNCKRITMWEDCVWSFLVIHDCKNITVSGIWKENQVFVAKYKMFNSINVSNFYWVENLFLYYLLHYFSVTYIWFYS